jgi:competence protein ComEC
MAAHDEVRGKSDALLHGPARCAAEGRVTGQPVRTRGTLRWDAVLETTTCEDGDADWSGRVALYGGPSDLARGDRVAVIANLATPQRFWNDDDPRPADARRGIARSGMALDVRVLARGRGFLAWIDRARAHVRTRIDATFPEDTAPMARALVLGEADLTPDDDASFRDSGLSHLLAVSGMHLVLVVVGMTKALRGLLVRIEWLAARCDAGRLAAIVGIPVVWIYAGFAGGSGSAVRAAWMLTAAFAARAIGRRTDGPRAFGLSIVAMALVDPLVAFDVSFMLSAAATGGLLFLSRPLATGTLAYTPSWLATVVRSASTTIAATLPCIPILAHFAPRVPLGGILANLVAVPVGEMAALPLCLVHAGLAPWPDAERGGAAAASGALVCVRLLARAFASLRMFAVEVPMPTSWELVVLAAGASALAFQRGVARGRLALAAMAALVLAEIMARREAGPRGVLRATFLDVGQGDSAIIDFPDGRAMVIDGGGLVGSPLDTGERVLAPALRGRRRSKIAVAVLSHPHPDHFIGLRAGLAAVDVGALWDTGQGEREGTKGGYAELLAIMRQRGVPIVRPDALCGAPRVFGEAMVEALAPCPEAVPDRGANDNSFVLRITYGARAFLFVGDAEHEAEADLLARIPEKLRADVLKVGHHGSRTSSTPAFLAAVHPSHAVISSGVRNRFGHPHPATLEALSRAGIHVWRTDHDGAVVATTDGATLEVFSAASH